MSEPQVPRPGQRLTPVAKDKAAVYQIPALPGTWAAIQSARDQSQKHSNGLQRKGSRCTVFGYSSCHPTGLFVPIPLP